MKKHILLSQLCAKVLPETEHLGEQFGVSNSKQFLHLSAEREYKEKKQSHKSARSETQMVRLIYQTDDGAEQRGGKW